MFVFSLVATVVAAQAGPSTPLHYHAYGPGEQPWGGISCSTDYPETRPPKGYTTPPGLRQPRFFHFEFGPESKTVFGVEGITGKHSKVADSAWIDWAGDKVFGDKQKLIPVEGTRLFIPRVWPTWGGREVRAAYEVKHDFSDGGIAPAGYMAGVAHLIGRDVSIAFIDSYLDGAYGDHSTLMPLADVMLIDRNGDGKFGPCVYETLTTLCENEMQTILPLMQLDGKNLYSVKVAEDGSGATIQPYDGPMGTVSFPGAKDATAALNGPNGPLWVRAPHGIVDLPAGKHDLRELEYEVPDAKLAGWTIAVSDRFHRTIEVVAGKPVKVPCGLPFKLTMRAKQIYGGYRLTVELVDAGGNQTRCPRSPKNWWPEPYPIKVRDAHNRTVASIPLEFGRGFPCTQDWLLGSNVHTGKHTLTAVWPAGPFGTFISRLVLHVRN